LEGVTEFRDSSSPDAEANVTSAKKIPAMIELRIKSLLLCGEVGQSAK
jgi:hypothetical protein